MSVYLRKGNLAWADRKRKENNMAGAYETKQYRNVFAEYGYSEEEIEKRVQETFETIFHGSEEERFYHEAGEDMGFMEDTGNHDARTEGMSYGMMVCVQLDKKEEFDRLWKWTRTYMYMDEGPGKNYFEVVVPRPNQSKMSRMDWHISETCDFLQTWSGFSTSAFR